MAKRPNINAPAETVPTPSPPGADTQIVRANLERKVVQSPTFASIYANDVQIQMTPWDLRLILGEISEITDGIVTVNSLAEVRMSPQLAKRVVLILLEQLQGYEQKIGPIPQPSD